METLPARIQEKLGPEWEVEIIEGGLKITDRTFGDICYVREEKIERLADTDEGDIVDRLEGCSDDESPASARQLIAEGEEVHYNMLAKLAGNAK